MEVRGIQLLTICSACLLICLITVFASSLQLTQSSLSIRYVPRPGADSSKNTQIRFTNPLQPLLDWEFDVNKDGRNYGLSDEQCESAFPEYWTEIDRAAKYWKEAGTITEGDLSLEWRKDELVRAMIYDQQLYITDTKWARGGLDKPRAVAILSSIHRAIIAYPGDLPNIEFTFCVADTARDRNGTHPVWALTRRYDERQIWVMPDFGYWSWSTPLIGDYHNIRTEIGLKEPEWENKIDSVLWRGNPSTNRVRKALLNVTHDKDWADVQAMRWGNDIKDFLTLPDHCLYKYLIHTEGNSYSGRGKYLLNCNSVFVTHRLDWIEPHTHLFKVKDGADDQNAVLVDRNFTGLYASIADLRDHQDKAQAIATNGVAMFRDRYLTPAAQACYWRRMFRAWADVSFEPELYMETKVDGAARWTRRGTPFELFIAHDYEELGAFQKQRWYSNSTSSNNATNSTLEVNATTGRSTSDVLPADYRKDYPTRETHSIIHNSK